VSEKLNDINVSEEESELQTEEAIAGVPESPGGEPPKKTKRGTLPPDGGRGDRGGRSGRTTTPGLFARIQQFLHDTRAEMRRVSWPGAAMVKNTTLITLVAVVFFALYLFAIDRVWAYLIEHLRGWLGG